MENTMNDNRPNSWADSAVAEQGRGTAINPAALKVLKNTYMLLAMTLLFSAGVAAAAIAVQAPPVNWIVMLVVYFALLFAVEKTKNSLMGIVFVFALTGFLGYTLAPLVGFMLGAGYANIVFNALFTTGLIFAGMSGFVLVTGKDLSGMGKTLFIGILVAFVLSIVGVIFSMPVLSLAVSGLFVLLMSGLIAYQTSEIIHGGETNYISATVTLYVSLYNLFVSLLHLMLAFAGDD
jgi:modulator of FtsH protease